MQIAIEDDRLAVVRELLALGATLDLSTVRAAFSAIWPMVHPLCVSLWVCMIVLCCTALIAFVCVCVCVCVPLGQDIGDVAMEEVCQALGKPCFTTAVQEEVSG